MKTVIIIPTFNRVEKLHRCLESIKNQTYKNFDVYVYADNNDVKTVESVWAKALNNNFWYNKVHIIKNNKQEFVIGSWNKFFKNHYNNYDAFQWCVDDVELYPNFLEEVVKKMNECFPDTDGAIGTYQECPGRPDYTFKTFGQPLIGRKFVERYKSVNYQVCCPDYLHFFQDEELYEFASSLDKWDIANKAILKHYHPSFKPEEMDSTHPIVRGTVIKKDTITHEERKKRNYLWGKDFNLINRNIIIT